jgi:hypothetical protein
MAASAHWGWADRALSTSAVPMLGGEERGVVWGGGGMGGSGVGGWEFWGGRGGQTCVWGWTGARAAGGGGEGRVLGEEGPGAVGSAGEGDRPRSDKEHNKSGS